MTRFTNKINNSKFYCLIPAKGISKSIPSKNLIKIKNKNLLEITILNAKKSKYINKIYVSSENKFILNLAKKLNVIPVKRSKKYSIGDIEPKFLVREFLKLNKNISRKDFIVYLQPTSPMRTFKHIDDAIKTLIKSNFNSLTSVRRIANKYSKFVILKNNKIKTLLVRNILTSSRQSLKKIYLPNGAIYIFKVSEFIKFNNFPILNSLAYLMDNKSSLDIDTKDDLKIAKKLINK